MGKALLKVLTLYLYKKVLKIDLKTMMKLNTYNTLPEKSK